MSNNPTTVRLRDFFPDAQDVALKCEEDLFIPDDWTKTLATGIQKLDLAGSIVMEVGVGIGINMAGLMVSPNAPRKFIGTDICPIAVKTSQDLSWDLDIAHTMLRESDLLDNFIETQLTKIDHIFACIPQVPRKDIDLEKTDNFAHYYRPDGSSWDDYSLGLNNKLVRQTPKNASITLNLAGRSGLNILKKMFADAGRSPDVLYQRIVPQHLPTSLQSLAKMEENGHEDFEFYKDAEATQPMNAREAEEQRLTELPSGKDTASFYHKIYVMHAPAL